MEASFIKNLFCKCYIINPINEDISKKESRKYLITSIFIGIFSIGIPHLVTFLCREIKKFKVQDPKKFSEAHKFKSWKHNHFARGKDLDYNKPKKPIVKNTEVIKKTEFAIAETCLSYVFENRDGLMTLLNEVIGRYKDLLEAYVAVKFPHSDHKLQLYRLLIKIFSNTQKDSGSIGNNPLAILNLISLKKEDPRKVEATFREKMYFLCRLSQLINEVMTSKALQASINQWLNHNNKSWQLEVNLIQSINDNVPFFMKSSPLFCYGTQACQNATCFLRSKLRAKTIQKNVKKDPNLTFAASEQLSRQPLFTRYQTVFSQEEEFAYTGELPENDARKHLRREIHSGQITKADTCFAESPLEYKKRVTNIPWIPGKHYYKLHNSSRLFKYNRMVQDLNLPVVAGISGTIDQVFTLAGIVGFHSKEDLIKLRIILMGWMISSEDHSFHEMMQSSKSFNLDYVPGKNPYADIKPGDTEFLERLQQAFEKRGIPVE